MTRLEKGRGRERLLLKTPGSLWSEERMCPPRKPATPACGSTTGQANAVIPEVHKLGFDLDKALRMSSSPTT